ncbi:protein-L-isoaspartate O-methyltransferase [Caulobacter segnis]|jgi:protein-L-isoaspartate(D-aspartate) O-methyltransferase|uniref:protein-L-isoaspartate O-methyltransferase family protein n=1 Tax=Caulobacter segnis TaxID=88688 RepID=UPI00240F187F|nr:protein-L-isoaspartate O-methyltransferase [Caulobacter segnis]MDG2522484.1 protein-L-isoaspartate O-methyltransferase [Caulobacter segnis]
MSSDFAAARINMVDSQIRVNDVTDFALQDALRATPRETCVPADQAFRAYADLEVQYAPGRWLLRPRDVSKLLQALHPQAGEKALAIAAPYAGAVLENMGLSVTHLAEGDLTAVSGGPYDVIVVEGGVAQVPASWTAALAVGGRLGVVERSGPVGRATVYVRAADGVGRRVMFDSAAPLLAGFEPEAKFAF